MGPISYFQLSLGVTVWEWGHLHCSKMLYKALVTHRKALKTTRRLEKYFFFTLWVYTVGSLIINTDPCEMCLCVLEEELEANPTPLQWAINRRIVYNSLWYGDPSGSGIGVSHQLWAAQWDLSVILNSELGECSAGRRKVVVGLRLVPIGRQAGFLQHE